MTVEPASRLLRQHRSIEIGYWLAVTVIGAVGNSLAVMMEHRRVGDGVADWEPWVWEWSSQLLLLALVPVTAWFTRRWPLHWDTWRRHLPLYAIASIVWSLLHVLGMVALRKLAYVVVGGDYDFGVWPRELLYEYLKDVRGFAGMVLLMHVWRWMLLRAQGEASVLAPGEDDAPAESASAPPVTPLPERPQRFLVRKLDREFLIDVDAIDWAQASGNYVNLHVGGRVYPLRSTMTTFEEKLDPARFVRVHRSHIVNLARIASIEPIDSGDARIHLTDGSTLPCSRRYRDALRPA